MTRRRTTPPRSTTAQTDRADAGPPTGTTYRVPRGRCPRCRSPEVTHLVVGLMAGPLDAPAWAVAVGCCPPAHDRVCQACGWEWVAPTPEAGPDLS